MQARVTTMTIDPDKIDEVVAELEQGDIPKWKDIDGWKGFTLLVDRQSGKVVATSYWATRERMASSEEQVKGSRDRAAETGGATDSPQVEHFEVAIDAQAGDVDE
jgi:heme-degrading monooxygenase HmoA